MAKEFIESYDIGLQLDCDYWNDQNEDGHYYCDLALERADSQVDIYYNKLRSRASDFSDYVNEALEQFGYDKKRGIIRSFQLGQYLYYSQFS